MAPSIHFEKNYIKLDLSDDVKAVEFDGKYYFVNNTTTNDQYTWTSTNVTVYYLDNLDHPPRKFPVKVGATFTSDELVTVTGGGLAELEVVAKDPKTAHTGKYAH